MALGRPSLVLWCVGAAVFILALFHSMGGSGPASDLVQNWKPSSDSTSGHSSGSKQGHGHEHAQDRLTFREHVARSEKSWEKTVMQRHELLAKDWGTELDKMPYFPCRNNALYQKYPYSIWDFVPASYSCPHDVERIGKLGDGGKWVCGMSVYEKAAAAKTCVIYSFGVNDDSSFEEEMLSRTNCEIWAYDFSVEHLGPQLTENHKDRAHFMKIGISGETDLAHNPPMYTIADLMKKNGHDYIDILKIDIEWAEYKALTRLSKDYAAVNGQEFPIGQMMIEIHLFQDGTMNSAEFLNWWEMLEDRGLRPTWTEPNLLVPTLGIEGGMPSFAEYTFINAKNKRNVLFEGSY